MKKMMKKFGLVLMCLLLLGSMSVVSVIADGDVKPRKVKIEKSSMTVHQGKEFKIKAKMTPRDSDDDYLRWEIVSGKKYVRFEDTDRDDDEIELKALKPGKAQIRCYIKGKNKKKYGDVITVTVKKRKADYSLSRAGKKNITVEVGDDFDLEVKHGFSIKERDLKWKIQDTKIVRFEDRSRTGDDAEFIAKKPGTTKITCVCSNKNAKTKKIVYTVKVVPDDDDDDDDDDFEDYDD